MCNPIRINGLGTTDWNQIASAANAISSGIQSGATAYNTVVNSLAKPTAAVQQYLQPSPANNNGGSGNQNTSNNTWVYVAIAGVGVLGITTVVVLSLKKKKSKG